MPTSSRPIPRRRNQRGLTPHQERGPRRVYANDAIEVHWEPTLCIHTKSCVRNAGGCSILTPAHGRGRRCRP